YRLKYYTQAIESWSRLSTSYPKAKETEDADYQIADTYFKAQKYAEVGVSYKKIIARYPKSRQLALAWLRIAQTSYYTKNDSDAVSQSKEVLKQFPESTEVVDALDLMDSVFDRSPDMDYKTVLSEIVAASPRTAGAGEAQFRLGRRLYEEKSFSMAIEELKKFSVEYTAHPSLAKAQFYLGESYFQNKDMENAISVFERLVDNFSDFAELPKVLFRMGGVYFEMKKYPEAADVFRRLIDFYPDSEYIKPSLYNLALCYKFTGRTDLAQETYRRYGEMAGEKDENAQAAQWEIFNLQKARGDADGAMKTLEQIYAAFHDTENGLLALYMMGELQVENNRPDEARETWAKLIPLKPLKSPSRLNAIIKLGDIYEKDKDYSMAASLYDDIARNSEKPSLANAARKKAADLRKMKAASPGKAEQQSYKDEGTVLPKAASSEERRLKPVSERRKLPGMERMPAEQPGWEEGE
ncbi:MAG: tetratricopeptide repeat protein, partial [bacterium]